MFFDLWQWIPEFCFHVDGSVHRGPSWSCKHSARFRHIPFCRQLEAQNFDRTLLAKNLAQAYLLAFCSVIPMDGNGPVIPESQAEVVFTFWGNEYWKEDPANLDVPRANDKWYTCYGLWLTTCCFLSMKDVEWGCKHYSIACTGYTRRSFSGGPSIAKKTGIEDAIRRLCDISVRVIGWVNLGVTDFSIVD